MQPRQTFQLNPMPTPGLVPPAPQRRHRRSRRRHSPQMPLPLPLDGWNENALRVAHRTARVSMPFEMAMQSPAMAICLRCLTEARQRKSLVTRTHDRPLNPS